jgi:putative membrane protein
MMGNYYGAAAWMWVVGGLMMLIFWGGLIALVVWAIRQFTPSQTPTANDPMAILRRRLASGEITQEQFEQARRALGS